MENNYIHGRIYKLVSKTSPYFYFGSTMQTLRQRFNEHKYKSKIYKNSKLYQQFSYQNFSNNEILIQLIEECIFKNEKELREIENRYIQCEISNINCLNSFLTGLNEEEQRDQNKHKCKKYYQQNKQKILEYQKAKIKCECGRELRKADINRHLKSKTHQQRIESLHN